MGRSVDGKFTRWRVDEMWSLRDGEFSRWGIYDMESSADVKFTI